LLTQTGLALMHGPSDFLAGRSHLSDKASGGLHDDFAASTELTGPVRDEIAESWRRSVLSGLRPDCIQSSYEPDLDLGSRFAQAAGAVADQLSDDLSGVRMALLVADEQARLIDRRVSDRTLRARLDQIMLAPGFRHSEQTAGTNAIGTALQQAGPVAVAGREHFAYDLRVLACSAAPVTDPRTGAILGAVGLTCQAVTVNPLMLPLVKRASRDIEDLLLKDTSAIDAALLSHFVEARRRAKGPLASLNEQAIHMNAAASRLLQPADHALLWAWAALALATGTHAEARLSLTSGQPITARVEAVHGGRSLAGALIRFDQTPAENQQARSGRGRSTFGWDSLTDTERGVAGIVAEGATNRQVSERLHLSLHTIDYHLRQIFRKLDISSRVELTRLVIQHDKDGHGPAA
jgi:transcriptional regulator of acetoin/glycerol metabolism